jgi:hypothetical protein
MLKYIKTLFVKVGCYVSRLFLTLHFVLVIVIFVLGSDFLVFSFSIFGNLYLYFPGLWLFCFRCALVMPKLRLTVTCYMFNRQENSCKGHYIFELSSS